VSKEVKPQPAANGGAVGKTGRWTQEGLNPKLDQNLTVYIPTGMLYVRKRFGRFGIPDLQATPTGFTIDQKLRARAARDQIIEDHRRFHQGESAHDPRGRVRLIGNVVDEILATRPESLGLRKSTVDSYRLILGKIKDYWGGKSLSVINEKSFDEWIAVCRKQTPCRQPHCPTRLDCKTPDHNPRARQSYCDYSKFMNILCRYAHQKKYTHYLLSFKNPDKLRKTKLLEKMRQGENRGVNLLTVEEKEVLDLQHARLLTRDEINRLWAAFSEDTKDQFACAFGCIMRKRETLQAPWSEIDLQNGIWTLPAWRVKTGSKTGKGRSFRIAPWALERLRIRHTLQGGSSRFVFPGWSKRGDKGVDKPVGDNKRAWKAAKDRAGIGGTLRWHDIRHTALTFALLGDPGQTDEARIRNTRKPTEVAEFAGVSEATIRRVYLRTQVEHTQAVASANVMDLGMESPVHAVFTQPGSTASNVGTTDDE
jgi:integrase